MALREVAKKTAAHLNDWLPAEFPMRPSILRLDDGQIVDAAHRKERGERIAKEEQQQLSYFGSWRKAVWETEQRNAGRLMVLIRSVEVFEAEGDHENATRIRNFVLKEYGWKLPSYIPESRDWRMKRTEYHSRNMGLLPMWLRIMVKPPFGRETRTSGEPAPATQQASLPLTAEDDWEEDATH